MRAPGGAKPSEPAPDAAADEPVDEYEVVLAWRIARMTELGFDYPAALELAIAGADWHAAARMKSQGATCDQVVQLLV